MSMRDKLATREPVDRQRLKDLAVPANTSRSLDAAVRHFEKAYGGMLPATSAAMELYIAWCIEQGLAISTVSQRVALLARWHREHSFVDPTQDQEVKAILKGARREYNKAPKKATPLSKDAIRKVVMQCDREITEAGTIIESNPGKAAFRDAMKQQLIAMRDKALFLTGFYFAFRSDELINLDLQSVRFTVGERRDDDRPPLREMEVFLSSSKGDREALGRNWKIAEMRELCPVNAMLDWISTRGSDRGPVFVKIDRWGAMRDGEGLHPNSVIKLMRTALARAGLPSQDYSSHSLRRGFANYAISEDVSERELMSWVKWSDLRTVRGYIDDNQALPNKIEAKSAGMRKNVNRLTPS